MLVAAGASAQRDSTPKLALVVHVCAETGVDEATLQRATSVAERLMMTAGVDSRWRACRRSEPSAHAAKDAEPDIVVLLMSRPVGTEPDECGFAHRGTSTVGTAMASVQCVEAFTMRVARMSTYRSHPLLAGGQSDDMVGVVVAHEIGHLLGLQHASKGVMRTRLDAEDIIAFRSGRLRFTTEESAHLRAASAVRRSALVQGRH